MIGQVIPSTIVVYVPGTDWVLSDCSDCEDIKQGFWFRAIPFFFVWRRGKNKKKEKSSKENGLRSPKAKREGGELVKVECDLQTS